MGQSVDSDQRRRGEVFQALHHGETFVIPNPWDTGSARVLESLGFQALATTSSGFAFTLGRPDGAASLEELAEHVRSLNQATALPVSVDLENGHGPDPEHAAAAIELAFEAGAVGGSIEDWDPETGLYPLDLAVARIAAAAATARGLDCPFMLTARAENHIRGNPDLQDTIARLTAYEEAGADVLYAPGLRGPEQIRAVCSAVSSPVNVLAHPGITVQEIAQAGGRRISLGGALAWTAAEAMAQAAERIRDQGDFAALGSYSRIRGWLAEGPGAGR
jgi:2-methylisocitrate lyase-like PEP mutase family enzyme